MGQRALTDFWLKTLTYMRCFSHKDGKGFVLCIIWMLRLLLFYFSLCCVGMFQRKVKLENQVDVLNLSLWFHVLTCFSWSELNF